MGTTPNMLEQYRRGGANDRPYPADDATMPGMGSPTSGRTRRSTDPVTPHRCRTAGFGRVAAAYRAAGLLLHSGTSRLGSDRRGRPVGQDTGEPAGARTADRPLSVVHRPMRSDGLS